MPWPIVYTGGQDDDRTRAIDVVHIEPSIREGVHLVSSLYGKDASAPLYRYPPVNLFPPYLTGPQQIPGRLVCNAGQWDGSPSPVLYYQWMRDGVDVPGANQYEYFTTEVDDNTVMTCEVRGANYLGEDYALTSNSIAVSLIEPIELREMEDYIVTGIQASKHITIQDRVTTIVTGVAAEDRMDINRSVAYFITGRAAEDRHDINAMNMPVITGLQVEDLQTIFNTEVMAINQEWADPLVEGVLTPMNLKNYDAEFGIEGWEIFGAVTYTDFQEVTQFGSGDHCWWGGENVHTGGSNIPYSYMWQDVPIEPSWVSDVDGALCYLSLGWYQRSFAQLDQANIKIEFLQSDASTVISSYAGPGFLATPTGIWYYRSMDIAIPPNTRYVRVIPEFNLIDGTDLNAFIDSILMFIRKGAKVNSRDRGPSFEQWRLRFTLSNTYSGCALSELAFRDSPGGTDLATGGFELAGSEGQGGLAIYAFDDLINTGYWAGEISGVGKGTAWVGYDMTTPVRPRQLAITARPDTNSLQMGREFWLEGSDDGIYWVPVQFYDQDQVGTFASQETKYFTVVQGAFDYFTATAGGTYSYSRDLYSYDDYAGKGNVYRCDTRLDITHLRVMIDDNSLTPFNYRLQLLKISPEKDGSYGVGMVEEILEDIALVSPGTDSGLQWVEAACLLTHEFEGGEYFCVRFYDVDAATNPIDPNEGRTRWISSWNSLPNAYETKGYVAKFINSWAGGTQTPAFGEVNPSASNKQNTHWAVDFKGSVF